MVDADTPLAAPQPITDTAESLVSFVPDEITKQSQDAEVSDTQLVTDNGTVTLSKSSTEELDIESAVLENSDAMKTEDIGLKKSNDGDDNGGGDAVDTKDVAASTISEVSINTDNHTSIPEETSEAFKTEVSPSAQESTLSIEPSSCDTQTEPAPESTVDSDSLTIVGVEAPATEQQAAQTTIDTSSHINEEIAEATPVEEGDTLAELGIEKTTSVDNESAEKEAESSKLMAVEDKTTESNAKEEAAIDIKADETHVESAIPQVNIQIEEADVTLADEIAETINVGSHNADDSLIVVEVVAPTPALIDNRQLEESDTDDTPTPEGFHEKATSTHAIPLEDMMAAEGTCTPRAKPETEEYIEGKASVKKEAVENESSTSSSTGDEAIPIKEEEMTDAEAVAPTKTVEEKPVDDESISSESVEIITGGVSAINFAPAVVEEHIYVQGEASTEVRIVAEEEVVPNADISFVEGKPMLDDAASTNIPETQFAQEESGVPVSVPKQENVGEVVTTKTEFIPPVAPVTIAEPQSVQDAPPDIVVAAEDQRTKGDLLHEAAIDLVQTSQTPAIGEFNDMTEQVSPALVTVDLTPEPAAKAVVTHEIPVAEETVITQEEVVETAVPQGQAVDANDLKNAPTEFAEESAIGEVVSGAEAGVTVDFEIHQVTEEKLGVAREVSVIKEGKENGTDVKVTQEFEEPMEEEEFAKDSVLEKPMNEPPSVEEFVKEEAVIGEMPMHNEAVSEPAKEKSVAEISVGEPVKEEPVAEISVGESVKEEPVAVESVGELVKEDLVPDKMPMKEELVAEEPVEEELMVEEITREEFAMTDASAMEEVVIKESIKGEPSAGEQVEEEPATEDILAKEELVVEGLKDESTAGVLLKSEIFVGEVAEKGEPIAEELAEKEPIVRVPIQEGHVLEAPSTEPVAEQILGSVVTRLPAEEDHAVGERPTIENLVVEEVSGKDDFAVEEPVQEETIAEEPAKAQPITEAVGEESKKGQLVAEKKDEFFAEDPAKEDSVVENVPAEEEAEEPTKKASVVEEPINEDNVVDEPVQGELIIKSESELVGSVVEEVAPDESAVQKEVVEELFVGATAVKELIPVVENIPVEDVGHSIIITSKETVAVGSLVDQDVSVGQTSASQPVEDVESPSGEHEADVEESVLEDATADSATPILEEEKSTETPVESIVDKASDQPTIISAPVVVTEEPVAQATPEPPVQDTVNVNKAGSNVLFAISPPEPDHGLAAVAVAEQSAQDLVVDGLFDQEAAESIKATSVVFPPILSDNSATKEVNIDDSALEDSPTEKLAAANDGSPTVALIESLSDESVLMGEISIADTTTDTIIVPELNEEKKVEDMVPVVEEVSILNDVETFMPEKFILSIPDDSVQLEDQKSPWTPSFQVTTLGHGNSLTTEESISVESLCDVEDVEPTGPDIMVDTSPSDATIETAQPPTEVGEPESATLSWTPSYSVHSQGTSSPSHGSLELTTTNTEDENSQVFPTDHDDTFVTQISPDIARIAERPSINEATEVQDKEVPETQDVQVIKDSSHAEQAEQDVEAVVIPQVIGQQAVECESLVQEPVQDESVPYCKTPTEVRLGSEITEKPFIAQISSLIPTSDQDRPVSPSWVPSYSVSQQGSPLPEQVSPPNIPPVEIVTTTTFGEPLSTESGRSQVDIVSALPIVELNGSQLEDTQEEPTTEDHPSAAWTSSYSVTQQGCDVFEESQLETLVEDDLSIEREPRRSLSEEIEGSNGFSAAALIGASIFGNPASTAILRKSTASFKSAQESVTNILTVNDTTPSGSYQRNFFPSLEKPDENRLHASSLRPLDENIDTLDLSSSFSTDASLLSSRKRLESTTSSRLLPGGWLSSTSKIPDERTSPEVARGIFTGTKQIPVEETLISPMTVPNSPVRQQSSDKRKCLIM